MVNSFEVGCTRATTGGAGDGPNECADLQFAVFLPPNGPRPTWRCPTSAVLFLPALLTTGSVFVPLVAHLQDLPRMLPDRPGTGASDPVSSAPIGAELGPFGATLLPDRLDGLGLDCVNVGGVPMGGNLSLGQAATLPHRVGRMVAFDIRSFDATTRRSSPVAATRSTTSDCVSGWSRPPGRRLMRATQ